MYLPIESDVPFSGILTFDVPTLLLGIEFKDGVVTALHTESEDDEETLEQAAHAVEDLAEDYTLWLQRVQTLVKALQESRAKGYLDTRKVADSLRELESLGFQKRFTQLEETV